MAQKFCRDCGGQGDEFGLTEITGYDWDSDDDDALSERIVIGHQCANRSHCARETVGNPNATVRALRTIAADFENLGSLATRAREILTGYARIAQQQAHTDDLVARENGIRI